MLAFKPVWAAAFLLVPLVQGRWRMVCAMVATGFWLVVVTLPLVGIHSWLEWLQIGKLAAATFESDQNWIELSRDILSIPRRWLDFQLPWFLRVQSLGVRLASLGLYLGLLELTFRWACFRRRDLCRAAGEGAAFLLLGAWLSCFHFMYYDVLLTLLPVCLLFTQPRSYLEPWLLAMIPLKKPADGERALAYFQPTMATDLALSQARLSPGIGQLWVLNRVEPTALALLVVTALIFPLFDLGLRALPFDTFFLVGLWLWCGWLVYWRLPEPATPAVVGHAPGGREAGIGSCPAALPAAFSPESSIPAARAFAR
jgi:hypothetical protein